MARLGWGTVALCALAAGCGSSSKAAAPTPAQTGSAEPTASRDGFTYYGNAGGMPADVWDVSTDEAGNVYVAAGDTVLAKSRGDAAFTRFDAAAAGITANCDAGDTVRCPVVSVAGGVDPGVAVFGLQGVGTDGDYDPGWQLDSGGADVLAWDGSHLTRSRHVHVAGWPHQMCLDHSPPPCYDGDQTWEGGRRKCRQILRIAVDHGAGHRGDVWMAGTHCTFSLLMTNPAQRGWIEPSPITSALQDRHAVWEHDHPAMTTWATIGGVHEVAFLTGDSTAIAVDPTTGDPWAANETRLASKQGAGARADSWDAPMWPPWTSVGGSELGSFLDVWPDPRPADLSTFDALDPRWADYVSSLSFCADGTLWIASTVHGLARRARDGSMAYVALPDGTGNDASAVACDPSDGSVWVGFGWGGFGRWNGTWWTVAQEVPPDFAARGPVRNIQIDRWSSPRVVWIAHAASRFGPGGVTRYDGR